MVESGGAGIGSSGLRRKSEVETEFDQIVPIALGKPGRLEPRRFSALSGHSKGSVGESRAIPGKAKRISVQVVPTTSVHRERFDYLEKGFCWPPKLYHRFAIILCSAQAVLMLLWLTSIILVKYYWPAPHFIGKFLPAYLSNASGRARIIVFACLGSAPIMSFLLLGASLLLLRKGIRWLRIFYVVNTWLGILLLVVAIHTLAYAANTNLQNLEELLREALLKYDDTASSRGMLSLSTTEIDTSSQDDWDQIQYHFQCCGIHNEKDWYKVRNFFDEDDLEKDPLYWRVPRSCCLSTVTKASDIRNCVRYPENHPQLVNRHNGCSQKVLAFLQHLGAFAGIQILINGIVQFLSIQTMMSFYAILRYDDGTGYRRTWKTLLLEFFFVGLIREQNYKTTSRNKSQWFMMPMNKVIRMDATGKIVPDRE